MLKSPCPLFDKRRINSWWHRCTHWWHIINSRLIEVIIVATHNERKRRPKSRHFMAGECPAKTSPLYSEWTPQHLECCGMLKTLNWTSLDHEHWVSKLAMLQDWQETGTVTDWSWFTCKQQGEPTGRYCRGSPGRLISRKISFQGQRESGIGFPKKLFPNIFIAENQFLFVYYFLNHNVFFVSPVLIIDNSVLKWRKKRRRPIHVEDQSFWGRITLGLQTWHIIWQYVEMKTVGGKWRDINLNIVLSIPV